MTDATTDAITDVLSDADRDTGARVAAAAIEAVLDERYPEVKLAFWSAVEKLYRLDTRAPSADADSGSAQEIASLQGNASRQEPEAGGRNGLGHGSRPASRSPAASTPNAEARPPA